MRGIIFSNITNSPNILHQYSQALFGDVDTHTNNVLPQIEGYVHRFGPGLVLYWFGHAPLKMLGDSHGDVVIVGGELPEMMLLPTGDVHDLKTCLL